MRIMNRSFGHGSYDFKEMNYLATTSRQFQKWMGLRSTIVFRMDHLAIASRRFQRWVRLGSIVFSNFKGMDYLTTAPR
ncbi:5406_t:CDS:2 [Rhizophagus irregularis]|nr:5406_t:CDS:2 [Rhizophagus irregularis]